MSEPLIEGEDYYLEDGLMVFTAAYHLRRGYCCESGCRNCPYEGKPVGVLRSMPGISTQCESCGEPFRCGAILNGCWCAEMQLSENTRRDLQTRFKKCLCRQCLEKIQAESGDD